MRRLSQTLSVMALVGVAACGGQAGPSTPGAVPTPAATPSATGIPSPTLSGAPTPAPATSATPAPAASPSPAGAEAPARGLPSEGFGTSDVSGGNPIVGSAVVAVRVGSHPGYDRFVIEFAGPVPSYAVRLRPTSIFTLAPRGAPVVLAGAAGVTVKVFPVTNWSTYAGPTALTPGFHVIHQARLVENFEAVQQWGLGVSAPASIRVTVLAAPTRLVVDVATR